MPQSPSSVYIHLVFSTKDRRPFLHDKPTRDALHAFLSGVSNQMDCPSILVGGVEDHVHLLARFGRTLTQAEWVFAASGIPTGFCPKAQGCEARATLGHR